MYLLYFLEKKKSKCISDAISNNPYLLFATGFTGLCIIAGF